MPKREHEAFVCPHCHGDLKSQLKPKPPKPRPVEEKPIICPHCGKPVRKLHHHKTE